MLTPDLFGNLVFWIFKSLWESKGEAWRLLNRTLRQKIYEASKVYERNYIARHGILKTPATPRPIELDELYICPDFLHGEFVGQPIRNLAACKSQNADFSGGQYLADGFYLAKILQFLIVLGEPGIGKTTFLKKVGLETFKQGAQADEKYSSIPVFIELRRKAEESLDLKQLIVEELRICGLPDVEMFTQSALEQGKFQILLDGLDEVPLETIQEMVAQIQNFVDTYHKNRFIISCRTAAYPHNLRRFYESYIVGFNRSHIKHYINNWFTNHPLSGKLDIDTLISTYSALTQEIAHNPSHLNIFCSLYKRQWPYPVKRSELYEAILRFLLEDWPCEKGMLHHPWYEQLDLQTKEDLLATLAYQNFRDKKTLFSRMELAQQIEKILTTQGTLDTPVNRYSILAEIQIRSGIFIEVAENVYAFFNPSIQSVLCAHYIANRTNGLKEIIPRHINHSRWREVFIALAGINQADTLLLKLNKHIKSYLDTDNLQQFIAWFNQSTLQSNFNQEPVLKRLLALFLVIEMMLLFGRRSFKAHSMLVDPNTIRTLMITFNSQMVVNHPLDPKILEAFDLSFLLEVAIRIAEKIEAIQLFQGIDFCPFVNRLNEIKDKIQDRPISRGFREECLEYIHRYWLFTLGIHESWISFSRREFKLLHFYLQGCQLMMDCLNEAALVSDEVVVSIRSGILSLPQGQGGAGRETNGLS